MKSMFEEMGGTYTQVGDFLLRTSILKAEKNTSSENMAGCGNAI